MLVMSVTDFAFKICGRPRMFIQRNMLKNIMALKSKQQGGASQAMLWLFSYLFLLRVPSEVCFSMVRVARGFCL